MSVTQYSKFYNIGTAHKSEHMKISKGVGNHTNRRSLSSETYLNKEGVQNHEYLHTDDELEGDDLEQNTVNTRESYEEFTPNYILQQHYKRHLQPVRSSNEIENSHNDTFISERQDK